jgi:2-hydroxychromene-2-carboxylate isomerase
MGEVISLEARRQARQAAFCAVRPGRATAVFAFDLSSPYTYLAAERVDRLFGGVEWRPVIADSLHAGMPVADATVLHDIQCAAQERAHALRMPLVWPDRYLTRVPPTRAAMRVAAFAAEEGRAAAFVLAASRLAFCGGFDLDDPEILAEAAAAASLPLEACLCAAGDRSRDGALEEAGRRLVDQGADRLPAMRVGRTLFCGEDRLAEAVAAARAGIVDVVRPTPAPGRAG